MPIPQFITDLLAMLLDLAVPCAICTLVLAGVALRREGGVNFEAGGGFQKWMVWTAILLTVPQTLSWFADQGVTVPQAAGGITSHWLAVLDTSIKGSITNLVVHRAIPLLAAFFVLKAALDAAEGRNPLGSILTAMFVLTISTTAQMMAGWNSGSQFAASDMLMSFWNYLAGTILPAGAGLAIVGAIVNYVRQKPFWPLVGTSLAFLTVTGLWRLVEAMVN